MGKVERKKGEWLNDNIRKGGKGSKILDSSGSSLNLKDDLGITWDESSKAQS